MDAQGPYKIIRCKGSNFVNEQDQMQQAPMLLTAWTQTTGEDFNMLRLVDSNAEAENRALREKVRFLESKLKEHTDLLSQIHATSARMQHDTSSATQQIYDHVVASPSPPSSQQTQQHQILTPPNSVICAPQHYVNTFQRPEVIDYKIVASGGGDGTDTDAIEIRLAAESLNSLSTSADSDRLEICMGEAHQHKMKMEQELPHIKRRKLELQEISGNNISNMQQHNLPYKLPARKSTGSVANLAKSVQVKMEPHVEAKSMESVMVSIGPNDTCVPANVFESINWNSSSLATRKLLVTIFDRDTLATHSMTGKPSPAFRDQQKPLKQMLDPLKVQDIIFAVTRKCAATEKEVRNAITTKCADENKMMKIKKGKRCSYGGETDKENMLLGV